VTRGRFATALPLLLLPWFLGALPPAAAQVKGKTELDKLVSAARLSPLVGQEPPPFTLVRPDGRRVGLSDFTGHVVLLYLWTTTSPYAALEMPASIEKLQRDLKDRRFTVVAVNIKDTATAYLIGRDHKLVGRVQGTRGWDEGPTRELIDYLLKAPAR
jgi:cytochrome oxidase Cu insertion factor (SCO1/SenC/PrrC family)